MTDWTEIGDARLACGDCLESLAVMSASSVDHVITDPPYAEATHAGARTAKVSPTVSGDGKREFCGQPNRLIRFKSISDEQFLSLCHEFVSRARRWVIMNSDIRFASFATDAGLPVVRVGAWVKGNGAPQYSGDRPGQGWEAILILHREGKKKWNGGGHPAVWNVNIEHRITTTGFHPTQKPLALVARWLNQFTDPGETVLDPFMGSGTTGVACAKLGRKFIGIEIEPKYFDIACKRIEEAYSQGDFFIERPKAEQMGLDT